MRVCEILLSFLCNNVIQVTSNQLSLRFIRNKHKFKSLSGATKNSAVSWSVNRSKKMNRYKHSYVNCYFFVEKKSGVL